MKEHLNPPYALLGSEVLLVSSLRFPNGHRKEVAVALGAHNYEVDSDDNSALKIARTEEFSVVVL